MLKILSCLPGLFQKYSFNFQLGIPFLAICEVSIYSIRAHSVLISERGEDAIDNLLSLCTLYSLWHPSHGTSLRLMIVVVICLLCYLVQTFESWCHCCHPGGRRPGEPTGTRWVCPKGEERVSASQCKVQRWQKKALQKSCRRALERAGGGMRETKE